MMAKMILIVNDDWFFVTETKTIQSAIADLYNYNKGKIKCTLFSKTVQRASPKEAVELYNQLANEVPLTNIYTNCLEETYLFGKYDCIEAQPSEKEEEKWMTPTSQSR